MLETDPQTVAARVTMRGADAEVPIAEQVGVVAAAPAYALPACVARASTSDTAAAAQPSLNTVCLLSDITQQRACPEPAGPKLLQTTLCTHSVFVGS